MITSIARYLAFQKALNKVRKNLGSKTKKMDAIGKVGSSLPVEYRGVFFEKIIIKTKTGSEGINQAVASSLADILDMMDQP